LGVSRRGNGRAPFPAQLTRWMPNAGPPGRHGHGGALRFVQCSLFRQYNTLCNDRVTVVRRFPGQTSVSWHYGLGDNQWMLVMTPISGRNILNVQSSKIVNWTECHREVTPCQILSSHSSSWPLISLLLYGISSYYI
jgi:hypothetical protein